MSFYNDGKQQFQRLNTTRTPQYERSIPSLMSPSPMQLCAYLRYTNAWVKHSKWVKKKSIKHIFMLTILPMVAPIGSSTGRSEFWALFHRSAFAYRYGWRLDKQSPGMQQRNRAKLEPQLGPDSAAYTSNCYAAPQKDNYRILKRWNASRRDAQHPPCALFFLEIGCGCGIATQKCSIPARSSPKMAIFQPLFSATEG
jgi:hypothetical protein